MLDRTPSSLAVLVVVVAVTACAAPDAGGDRSGPADLATGPTATSPATDEPATAEPTSPAPSPTASSSDGPAAAATPADDREVLSPCSPAPGVETRVLVEPDGPRPDAATIDAALEGRVDLAQLVASLEREGVSTADARHAAYAQVVGIRMFEQLQRLPGYVPGRIADPTEGEPFLVAFADDVPDTFDPTAHDVGSYGLEVVTGAPGYELEPLQRTAGRAAQGARLQVKDVSDDIWFGTVDVEVLDATPAQVATFEAALDEPDRVCLVRVPPDLRCDDEVVAEAQDRAERQGEVVTGGTESQEAATAVERSHLGLTAEQSEAKAAEEQRAWRVGAEDGIGRALTADLAPGRITVVLCQDTVVAASLEGVDTSE